MNKCTCKESRIIKGSGSVGATSHKIEEEEVVHQKPSEATNLFYLPRAFSLTHIHYATILPFRSACLALKPIRHHSSKRNSCLDSFIRFDDIYEYTL